MENQKGIGYCGLACAVCSENSHCAGCRNGECKNKGWCNTLRCCKEKGLAGCWECEAFPCEESTVNTKRIRAFIGFIRKYGTDFLLRCLEKNERNGLMYHYQGTLTGDYDKPETEDEIIDVILKGREK
ncbi:MAG: DUF3795 domain-containing protein [Spirochaetales bacterium]|nr:DUF3795 domain-containing protein [Spirochaetales bacterium]